MKKGQTGVSGPALREPSQLSYSQPKGYIMSDTGSRLTPEHRAWLNACAVPSEIIDSAGFRSVTTRRDLPEDLAVMTDLTPVPGILFPHTAADGTKGFRYHPDNPAPDPKKTSGKPAKYVGTKATSGLNLIRTGGVIMASLNGVSTPHIRMDGFDSVLIVEGEKQGWVAGAYAPENFAVIGIPGCNNWKDADLSLVSGRDVRVSFDADLFSNPDVTTAALELSAALTDAGSASVRFLPPAGDGTDGLDDLFAKVEPDDRTDALRTLIEHSEPMEGNRLQELENAKALRLERARRNAREVLEAEDSDAFELPKMVTLMDLLAEPDEEAPFRISGLLPVNGRVIMAAEMKAGKTTAVGNLVRCLVDGDKFLDRYEVEPVMGQVVIIDTEMSRVQLRRWLRDQNVRGPDHVTVLPMRGQLDQFRITNPGIRARWAAELKNLGAEVIILDPLNPVLNACQADENNNSEVGKVLDALDALLVESGAKELILTHHMGHNGERSRGASKLRGWPDAEWKIVGEKDKDGEPAENARRFFKAFGRDVDVPESLLSYNPMTRRLSIAGDGVLARPRSRKQLEREETLNRIEAYVTANPGCLAGPVKNLKGVTTRTYTDLAKILVDAGRIHVETEGRSQIHRPGPAPDAGPWVDEGAVS